MELTIQERMLLISVLPQRGNMMLAEAVHCLAGKLRPSADDLAAAGHELIYGPGGEIVGERLARDEPHEIELSQAEIELLARSLRDADKADQLPIAPGSVDVVLSAWSKIMGANDGR